MPLSLHLRRRVVVCSICILGLALFGRPKFVAAGDVIEFLSGARMEGNVTKIDRDKKEVHFAAAIAGRTIDRVYRYELIHAVTYQGKRYVLNENGGSGSPAAKVGGDQTGQISRNELTALIRQAGETPPDWFASAPLDFPKSLDLSWPEPAPQGWNNQKNMGQYIWDIINPNPSRWQHGVKVMHHLMEVNQNNPATVQRTMLELGRMYHDLLEDDARAAYWWQRAGVGGGEHGRGPHLAACYARLGNRQMAVELLERLSKSNQGGVLVNCIKVWCDLGELGKAEAIARRLVPSYAQAGFSAGDIYLLLGDAHRSLGNYTEAVRYYKLVLAESDDLKGRIKQHKDRAKANLDSVQMFERSDVSRVADGTFRGNSLGYEDQIHVEVTVADHQITSVRVTQHKEKQFYSALTDTPAKIMKKNGVMGVDTTSSATITSEAIINATAKALAAGAQ